MAPLSSDLLTACQLLNRPFAPHHVIMSLLFLAIGSTSGVGQDKGVDSNSTQKRNNTSVRAHSSTMQRKSWLSH